MTLLRYSAAFVLGILLCTASLPAAHAQDDVEEALSAIGQQYAGNYLQPVSDALGAGLNSGLFRTAKVGSGGILPGIDLYIGVAAMGVSTAGSDDSFRLSTDQVTINEGTAQERTLLIEYPDRDLPTAFGENESPGEAEIRDAETNVKVGDVALPASLLDTPLAPTVVPQVGIGTVFGTDAQVRFLPETEISNYGSVGLTGVALRHSVSQYVPLLPVDLAVQGSWQQLDISGPEQDDILETTAWALNAQVSKSFTLATLYGGLQYETTDVDVEYQFTAPDGGTSTLRLDQDASTNVRALAGVSFSLAVVRLNVDYAIGANNTVTAGLGLNL